MESLVILVNPCEDEKLGGEVHRWQALGGDQGTNVDLITALHRHIRPIGMNKTYLSVRTFFFIWFGYPATSAILLLHPG